MESLENFEKTHVLKNIEKELVKLHGQTFDEKNFLGKKFREKKYLKKNFGNKISFTFFFQKMDQNYCTK